MRRNDRYRFSALAGATPMLVSFHPAISAQQGARLCCFAATSGLAQALAQGRGTRTPTSGDVQ